LYQSQLCTSFETKNAGHGHADKIKRNIVIPLRDKTGAKNVQTPRYLSVAITDLQAVKIGSVKLFTRWLGHSLHFKPKIFLRMASDSAPQNGAAEVSVATPNKKLQGRQFYESIGSPKYIVAPMVDRSEFVRLFHF
jgi:hypothetical protein